MLGRKKVNRRQKSENDVREKLKWKLMAEIVPSVSRYLRKLGVKKALQGRLGPCSSWMGCLMWWTRCGMMPLDKGIERQLRLCLWWEHPSAPWHVYVCTCVQLHGMCPGFPVRSFGSWRTENLTWVVFGHWARAGAPLVPSARTVGSQGQLLVGLSQGSLVLTGPAGWQLRLWGAVCPTLLQPHHKGHGEENDSLLLLHCASALHHDVT